ncbi:Argininosuccinate synthase [Metarhizium anisopliae]
MDVLAPWRIPEFFEQSALVTPFFLAFSWGLTCGQWSPESSRLRGPNQIPASSTPKARWSMDDNLAHCSYEAGILEQPELTSPENMWTRTGIPVKVEIGDKVVTGSLEIFKALNEIGRV